MAKECIVENRGASLSRRIGSHDAHPQPERAQRSFDARAITDNHNSRWCGDLPECRRDLGGGQLAKVLKKLVIGADLEPLKRERL